MLVDAAASNELIRQYIHEGILTATLAFIGWVVMYPLRTAFKTVKDEWNAKGDTLSQIQSELLMQRTNCLTTLQGQGNQQVELLKQMNGTLSDMHLDQRELLGHLKNR